MFVVNLSYIKPMSEVEKYVEVHMEFIKDMFLQNHIVCSGKKNPRTGGIVICNFADEEEARSILNKDPFVVYGVASYELIEFIPTPSVCIDGIKKILEKNNSI